MSVIRRIYRLRRQSPRAIDRRSSGRRFLGDRAISAARWASIRSSKSTIRPLPVEKGDVFVLATDGVHEYVGASFIADTIQRQRGRSRQGRQSHRRRGVSSRAARTTSRSRSSASTSCRREMPARFITADRIAVPAAAGSEDDFRWLSHRRELHASSRSHLYLAVDAETDARSSSRRRRSTCRATRPIWSDS